MHCALSPDGRAVATGSQCSDHCIDVIDVGGTVARAAVLRPRSEYPHNACFSDDGRIVALNACHFYSGESFVASVPDESQDENLDLSDKNAPTINGYLRVYASTWLPASTLGTEPGGFVLCGSGIMTCVTATGRVLFEQEFGSSAGAVDYSPKTQQLIVSSYSGFVHIYDIASLEQEGRVIGFKPRRERYRWVLWKGHDPFRW